MIFLPMPQSAQRKTEAAFFQTEHREAELGRASVRGYCLSYQLHPYSDIHTMLVIDFRNSKIKIMMTW